MEYKGNGTCSCLSLRGDMPNWVKVAKFGPSDINSIETLQANGNIVAVLLERKRKRTSVANRVVILRQTHVESVQLMLDYRWNAIRERTLRVFGETGAREER